MQTEPARGGLGRRCGTVARCGGSIGRAARSARRRRVRSDARNSCVRGCAQPRNRSRPSAPGPPQSTRTVSGSRAGARVLNWRLEQLGGCRWLVCGRECDPRHRSRQQQCHRFWSSPDGPRSACRVAGRRCDGAGRQGVCAISRSAKTFRPHARPPSTRPRSGRRCRDHIQVMWLHAPRPRELGDIRPPNSADGALWLPQPGGWPGGGDHRSQPRSRRPIHRGLSLHR